MLSYKRYEGDLDEEARLKKLNISVKQAASPMRKSISHQPSFFGQGANHTVALSNTHMTGFGNANNQTAYINLKTREFEHLLYSNHEDGPAVYRKYLGRMQIEES